MKYENSTLNAMFSGRFNLTFHKNKIFIDREFKPFMHMINYLRTGVKPIFDDYSQNLTHFQSKIIT